MKVDIKIIKLLPCLLGLLINWPSFTASSSIQQKFTDTRIMVLSIQKCGTHLLTKCVQELTGFTPVPCRETRAIMAGELPSISKKSFNHAHVPYTRQAAQALKDSGTKALFIYRDPRDQIVSMANWIEEKAYKAPRYNAKRSSPNYIRDLITELIPQTVRKYENFLAWVHDSNTLALKFEDLVGSRGGGSDAVQYKTLEIITQYLRLQVSPNFLQSCAKNLFGNSPTFRKGMIGKWKSYFTPQQKQLCKNHLGKLLINLGYEKDLNW